MGLVRGVLLTLKCFHRSCAEISVIWGVCQRNSCRCWVRYGIISSVTIIDADGFSLSDIRWASVNLSESKMSPLSVKLIRCLSKSAS